MSVCSKQLNQAGLPLWGANVFQKVQVAPYSGWLEEKSRPGPSMAFPKRRTRRVSFALCFQSHSFPVYHLPYWRRRIVNRYRNAELGQSQAEASGNYWLEHNLSILNFMWCKNWTKVQAVLTSILILNFHFGGIHSQVCFSDIKSRWFLSCQPRERTSIELLLWERKKIKDVHKGSGVFVTYKEVAYCSFLYV